MKSLVMEGKIRYVGLSECTPEELRRAHKVHPVTAIQMEWSLQTRDIEAEVVPTARELGVGIVAYSPLGRGFLSETFTRREDLDPSDWRLNNVQTFVFTTLAPLLGVSSTPLYLSCSLGLARKTSRPMSRGAKHFWPWPRRRASPLHNWR